MVPEVTFWGRIWKIIEPLGDRLCVIYVETDHKKRPENSVCNICKLTVKKHVKVCLCLSKNVRPIIIIIITLCVTYLQLQTIK